MPTGKCKWYSVTKGYGFIAPDAGGRDMFVHASALKEAKITSLEAGDSVSYEEGEQKGKPCANKIMIV